MTDDVRRGETTDDTTRDDTATADAVETAEEPDADETAATADAVETAEEPDADETAATADAVEATAVSAKGVEWSRVVAFIVLPAVALVLAAGAGYLKWRDNSVRNSEVAAVTSVQAAREATVALLSYAPDTVEQQLGAARDLLTGEFRESYTSLTNDVVIPGAKEQRIAAVASVPAASSVSADPENAVVLLFVNQTVTVGATPPTDTASSVRVSLEKHDGRWLISEFEPV